MSHTIVALATPVGIGAIGVIRLSGHDAIQIAQSVFSKDIRNKPSHTLHFGKIISPIHTASANHLEGEPITQAQVLDEVVLSIFKAPQSYTGENSIEISCHGSYFIQQKIIELLIVQGAQTAKPGEFTMRAFINGKLDLTQAEAVADLIASDSALSHKMAMDQMRGGFSNKIKELRQQLIDFASLIELELDFGEEDVEFADRNHLYNLVSEIHLFVTTLKDSFALGNVLKNGIATVIAGKPNAGKSTLLNALLNEERAIVSSIPGTTRDTVEEAITINGVVFRFIDTAGIRQSGDEIEGMGIEKTYEKLKLADLILYIFDANITNPLELAQEIKDLNVSDKLIIPIANKTDLCDKNKLLLGFSEFANLCYISGKKGYILELTSLLQTHAEKLNQTSQTLVNNSRHFEALHHSAKALEEVMNGLNTGLSGDFIALDIRKALFHLGEITGEISSDDLLANIFSRFCIGK